MRKWLGALPVPVSMRAPTTQRQRRMQARFVTSLALRDDVKLRRGADCKNDEYCLRYLMRRHRSTCRPRKSGGDGALPARTWRHSSTATVGHANDSANLPMTLAELSRHSLLIVTKLSLSWLRRRTQRKSPNTCGGSGAELAQSRCRSAAMVRQR